MVIERILSFFMMDIGEYHADIQRNCEAIAEILTVLFVGSEF